MNDSTWSDSDDAELAHASIDDGHPSRVVRDFIGLLWEDPLPLAELSKYISPETASDWGDFSQAREFARLELSLANRALRPSGALEVAYVKLVNSGGRARTSSVPLEAEAYVALVWRPTLGGWRIHRIGPIAHPDELYRESSGEAPRYESDVSVTLTR